MKKQTIVCGFPEDEFCQRVKILGDIGFEWEGEHLFGRRDLDKRFYFNFKDVPTADLFQEAIRIAYIAGRAYGKIAGLEQVRKALQICECDECNDYEPPHIFSRHTK